LVNVLSATLAFSLGQTHAERGLIHALELLVLAAELMNTGPEEVVDDLSRAPRRPRNADRLRWP
jgi:diacylglycerol kinase (ATP)